MFSVVSVMFTGEGWVFCPLTKGQILDLHCIAPPLPPDQVQVWISPLRDAPVLGLRMIPGLLMLNQIFLKAKFPLSRRGGVLMQLGHVEFATN